MKDEGQMAQGAQRYTAANAMMDALRESGIDYIFANIGTDYPALVEAWAKAKIDGDLMPEIIICPHETVALSAAHGYAVVSGKPQAVFIHVDVGTQNLGGTVHNTARGRVPVLIFAGASPSTLEGERVGSRNEYIQFVQDVGDQRGIVRQYVKWDYEARTGQNIKQLIYRALQIADSHPKGPVYLMAAREVLEEELDRTSLPTHPFSKVRPGAVAPEDIRVLLEKLLRAQHPLIMTSHLGKNPMAVSELVRLSERLAIPVIEVVPYHTNFPAHHPMHLGYQLDFEQKNDLLSQADLVLMLDSDYPILSKHIDSDIFYIDEDPLKEGIALWYAPNAKHFKADTETVLRQLNDSLSETPWIHEQRFRERYIRFKEIHQQQRLAWKNEECLAEENTITPQWLTACLREVIDDESIIINETITNTGVVSRHLPRTKPGTLYGSGASSLGWNGGAALGAKLAAPEKFVVSLTGDGSYIFSSPTAVHWISRKYHLPFLTIIYNNRGWAAPKYSTQRVHPNGYASQYDHFWVNFDPPSDLAKVAEAAGGAFAQTVRHPGELKQALLAGVKSVKEGRSAVIDVHLLPISNQMI